MAEVVALDAVKQAGGDPITVEKKDFYRTSDDSSGANCERKMRCGCLDPRYVITTEAVRIEAWSGCSRKNRSIDVDEVEDLSLVQRCTPGYCLYGRGHIRLYLKDQGAGEKFDSILIKHVENADKVFHEFSSHIHKINNLKFGIKRPDLEGVDFHVYDSSNDGMGAKFLRTIVCCGCCFVPHIRVNGERISSTQWTLTCSKRTSNFDLDHVEDVVLNRNCIDYCLCGTGTLKITGSDGDQTNPSYKHIGNAKKVYDMVDKYTNLLNNRDRIVGDMDR